jgi:hypothetical protein
MEPYLLKRLMVKGQTGRGAAAYQGNLIACPGQRTANALHPLIKTQVVGYGAINMVILRLHVLIGGAI